MFYTSITGIPALTINNLIALLGRNLGLFLGMSFLSFIEFIEDLFKIIYESIKLKKNKGTQISNLKNKSIQ